MLLRSVLILMLAIPLIMPALGQQTAGEWLDKCIALSDLGKYDESVQAYDKAIPVEFINCGGLVQ